MIALFSLGIFVVYYIFGVGMFNVLQEKSTAAMFRLVLAAVLLILGLTQMEDGRRLNAGRDSIFRTDWAMKYVHGALASKKLSSYFLLGALFSLVKAPCVGAVYIAIIGVISSHGYASSADILGADLSQRKEKVNLMVKIEVLGTGCAKCKSLMKNVEKALAESGVSAEVVKVDSIQEIMDRGVMMTPALYIDGKSMMAGRTATVEEIKRMLQK
jgi:small redox-active disulfide protein 2